jgi:hypothetical protein
MFVEAYAASVFPDSSNSEWVRYIVSFTVWWSGLHCAAPGKKKHPAKQPEGIILCSSGMLVATGSPSILRSACVALVLVCY